MTLHLTPRQAEVLELIGRERLTYAAAAERLGISSRTVADHAAAMTLRLTPRQLDVVRLVGGRRLSYKAAARRLPHRFVEGRTLSRHTVARYAAQIRDAAGLDHLRPRDACSVVYLDLRDELD